MAENPSNYSEIRANTKSGYVYVIRHGDSDYYKIGHTTSRPMSRLRDMQVGSPIELVLYEVFYVKDVVEAEQKAHKLVNCKRVRGEWFELNQWEIDQLMLLLEDGVLVYYDEMELYYGLEQGHRAIKTLGDYEYGDVLPKGVQ